MNLFLSYARRDRPKADLLAQRLRQLRHEAWLDTSLAGGQAWWDEILRRILECDVFVPVLSVAYTRSEACASERMYAMQLQKSLLPVVCEPMRLELLATEISRLHVIDYSTPGEESAIQLAVALSGISLVGLPPTLPPPPPVPMSYLSGLSDRITHETLTIDDQLALVAKLENALDRPDDDEDQSMVIDLLRMMSQRRDLYAETERKIQRVFASLSSVSPTDQGPPAPSYDDRPTNVLVAASPDSSPDPAISKSWFAEEIDAKNAYWRVQLHLSNETHLVELHKGIMSKLAVDTEIVWQRVAMMDSFEVGISDGDSNRTLKVAFERKGFFKKWPTILYVDDQELIRVET
jgi:hypothetical protein